MARSARWRARSLLRAARSPERGRIAAGEARSRAAGQVRARVRQGCVKKDTGPPPKQLECVPFRRGRFWRAAELRRVLSAGRCTFEMVGVQNGNTPFGLFSA